MDAFPSTATRDAEDRSFPRRRMVDAQVRSAGVSDPRILEAMRTLPRERFVPAGKADLAYMDDDVALGGGRVLMEPRVAGRLLQVLVPRRGERALVIGAGTGYAACILAGLGLDVVALEQDRELLAAGRAVAVELAPGIEWVEGALSGGLPDRAPFDLVLLDGAVGTVPHRLAPQLGQNGRLGGVLAVERRVGRAFLAEAVGRDLSVRPQFDATTALLPGFPFPEVFRF